MKQCKWEELYEDLVPTPFGSGSCSMLGSDCVYNGDIDISGVDGCSESCPAFEEYKEILMPYSDSIERKE